MSRSLVYAILIVIAVLAVVFVITTLQKRNYIPSSLATKATCQFCFKRVDTRAVVCPHCRKDLTPAKVDPPEK